MSEISKQKIKKAEEKPLFYKERKQDIEQVIREKLVEIEKKENVRIIMAVESGSWAWGFASPDSDYDVRFVYVRKLEDYLKLEKTRDVIEWQLDDTLDISGWDLKKALQLMHESNPSIFEWCASPIVYRYSPAFEKLQEIRKEYYSNKKSLYHYWHMANSNYESYLQDEEVRIKKYFYVIRPLLSAKWIVDHGTQPPMLFRELLDAELQENLRTIVDELLDRKQKMPEMGLGHKIWQLNRFIDSELEIIKQEADQTETDRNTWDTLNRYFMKQVTERSALNPYELQPSIGIDLVALTRYAKANGKTLTELSETEIDLFRNGSKETY